MMWTVESERLLLMNVIFQGKPTPPNWEEVKKGMGDGYSAEACRQHFGKLKKSTLGADSTQPATSGSPPSAKAPKSRKAKEVPVTTPKGSDDAGEADASPTPKASKKRRASTVFKEDSGSEEFERSPKKRVKRALKSSPTPKMEPKDEPISSDFDE